MTTLIGTSVPVFYVDVTMQTSLMRKESLTRIAFQILHRVTTHNGILEMEEGGRERKRKNIFVNISLYT